MGLLKKPASDVLRTKKKREVNSQEVEKDTSEQFDSCHVIPDG